MDHKTMDGCIVSDGEVYTVNEFKEYLQDMGFSYSEAADYIRSLPVKRESE